MAEVRQTASPAADRLVVGGNVALAFAAGVVLALSAIYSPETLPSLSVCTFRTATGLPCPGCGLTRSFCAISHGHLAAAWEFNPFGFGFYAGAVLLVLRPVLLWSWPVYSGWEQRAVNSRGFRVAPIVFVIAMLLFGVWRMVCAIP